MKYFTVVLFFCVMAYATANVASLYPAEVAADSERVNNPSEVAAESELVNNPAEVAADERAHPANVAVQDANAITCRICKTGCLVACAVQFPQFPQFMCEYIVCPILCIDQCP